MDPTTSTSATPPLAKYLASTDKKTRDKAVKGLANFLSTSDHGSQSKSEMAKLWKGIFYCYWMSDKPLVQQALSSELAELLLVITSVDVALSFLRGFWQSILREWNGIDRLRMDKYYMLVRKFINAAFRLLVREEWDERSCKKYNTILSQDGGPLSPEDTKVPSSLTYHVADVYFEELDKVMALTSEAKPLPAPLSVLLAPFLDLAARTRSNITYERIYSAVLTPLFLSLQPLSYSDSTSGQPTRKRPRLELLEPRYETLAKCACLSDPKKEGAVSPGLLWKSLLRSMFDAASSPDARETNRRKLYAIWKAAMAEEDAYEDERERDGS